MERVNPEETGSSLKRKRGRPPSSATRAAQAAREKAANTGLLPHEILLSIARGEPQKVWERNADGKLVSREVAVQDLDEIKSAAQAAAPYYAARISSVELISGIGDDDLDELIKRAAAEAEISLAPSGEGEAGAEEEEDNRPRSRSRNDFV
jgi:hypothetical protein